jgi:hypothetical protein
MSTCIEYALELITLHSPKALGQFPQEFIIKLAGRAIIR